MRYPHGLQRLGVLNAPHPTVMRRHLLQNRAQRRKSWYIFFFQLPWLPEWRTRRQKWRLGVHALQATSRPGTFSEANVERYR